MDNSISSNYEMSSDRGFRKLRPSFTKEESKFLLELMAKYKSVLIDKNKGFVTVEQRREAWQNIADELNSINPNVHRSCDEVKKRWQNLVYQATKDSQKLKGFYPGESPRVSEVSMGILTLIEEWPDNIDGFTNSNTSGCKIEFDITENDDDNNTNTLISDSPHSHQEDQNTSFVMNNSAAACTTRRNSAEKRDSFASGNIAENTVQPAFPQRTTASGLQGMKTSQHSSFNDTSSGLSDPLSVTSAPVRSKYLHPAYRDASLSSQGYDTSGGSAVKRRCLDFFSGSNEIETDIFCSEADSVLLDKEKLRFDAEKLEMAKEHLCLERQKLNIEREKFAMEIELERDKLCFEREKIAAEKERDKQHLIMEKEKFLFLKEQENERTRLNREQLEAEKQILAMEKEKLSLEIRFWKRKLLQQSNVNHCESEEQSAQNSVDH